MQVSSSQIRILQLQILLKALIDMRSDMIDLNRKELFPEHQRRKRLFHHQ